MSTHPLVAGRYGTGHAPTQIHMTPAVEAMLEHTSVRAFTGEPLPAGAIETMVAAAQSASTSSNLHMWSVVAVEAPERKRELQRLAASRSQGTEQAFVSEAEAVLLWVADLSRNEQIVREAGGEVDVFSHLDVFLMASLDAALAAQNAAVAAESMGLGICYLGSMRNNARELAEFLDLPPYAYVVFGMTVGVPDPKRSRGVRPRPEQNVVLHREQYRRADAPGGAAGWTEAYEDAITEYRAGQGIGARTWAESVQVATARGYMDGREHLRPALDERGFGFH